jgi:hypothetical protein
MMTAGWRKDRNRISARSYGFGGRSFFVPASKCQARVLECQALRADDSLFCLLIKKVFAGWFGVGR